MPLKVSEKQRSWGDFGARIGSLSPLSAFARSANIFFSVEFILVGVSFFRLDWHIEEN